MIPPSETDDGVSLTGSMFSTEDVRIINTDYRDMITGNDFIRKKDVIAPALKKPRLKEISIRKSNICGEGTN